MKNPQPEFRKSRWENTEAIGRLLELGKITVDTKKGIIFGSTGRRLKETLNFFGYRRVTYPYLGKTVSIFVHKAVWVAAGRTVPPEHEIDHINDDKQDCRLENLQVIHWLDNLNKRQPRLRVHNLAF